jgi:benzoyl-CoA reductase/2-hydroxyglutaryl-CoA dehydratase subunit BcrC/BadD/HgdB
MDKIIHEYHNILHPIHVPKIIEQPYIVEVNKPQHYIHYKEIPVEVQTNRNVPVRSIFDQLKEVNKEVEKTVSVEMVSEKLKEIVR